MPRHSRPKPPRPAPLPARLLAALEPHLHTLAQHQVVLFGEPDLARPVLSQLGTLGERAIFSHDQIYPEEYENYHATGIFPVSTHEFPAFETGAILILLTPQRWLLHAGLEMVLLANQSRMVFDCTGLWPESLGTVVYVR